MEIVRAGIRYEESRWLPMSFYFLRTNRGGGRSSGSKSIRQMARWMARRLIWNSGCTYEEITEQNALAKYMVSGKDVEENLSISDDDLGNYDDEPDYLNLKQDK